MSNDPPSYTTSSYSKTDLVAGSEVVVENTEHILQTAREIQALLNQLSEIYPTETLVEKAAVAEKAIAQIKSNRPWFEKILTINKLLGLEVFFQCIDYPSSSILRVGLEEAIAENGVEIDDEKYSGGVVVTVAPNPSDLSMFAGNSSGFNVKGYEKEDVSKEQEIKHTIDNILAEIQHVNACINERQETVKNLRLETQAMMATLGEIAD